MSDDFHELPRQAGAHGTEFLGASAPRDFGDPRAEYQALRESAVVADFSTRTQIELTGEDRAKYLHNLATNDIRKLPPGGGCEAFLLDARGHILFHVVVFVGETSLVIETVPGAAARLVQHLDRYLIREQVELHDRTDAWGQLLVAGPQAAKTLQQLGIEPPPTHPWSSTVGDWFGAPTMVRALAMFDVPAFALCVPQASLASAWNRLRQAGLLPCGHTALEALRIESGWPSHGIDITDKNLPQEVARDNRAISFVKGCYIGQETVARIDALGHVNKSLARLAIAGSTAPAAGAELKDGDQVVGHVSSAALVPAAAPRVVALAYLRRGYEAAQKTLDSPVGPATVVRAAVA